MDRTQQYIITLLDKIPASALADAGDREQFGKIRSSIGEASDLDKQLRSLYRVSNFSGFALGLLWIAGKVDRDPSKLESTGDEERFVVRLLKTAFGELPATQEVNAPTPGEDPFGFVPAQDPGASDGRIVDQTPVQEPTQRISGTAISGEDATPATAPAAGSGGTEHEFAATLEKLVEAIQSGSEERSTLLDQLTAQAEQVAAGPESGDDFKAFCGYMIEFLKYVSANQLFDDIRVMNMMSNVFDPFSQWAKADPSARAGLLDQPNEVLREFKSLFE